MIFQIEKQSSGSDIIPIEDWDVKYFTRTYVDNNGKKSLKSVWEIFVDSIDDVVELQSRVGCPISFQETDSGFEDSAPALTIVIQDD